MSSAGLPDFDSLQAEVAEARENEPCRPVAADPGCYGCLGTGEIQWAGWTERRVPCMCTWHCAVHDAPLQVGEELCAVMEARSDA